MEFKEYIYQSSQGNLCDPHPEVIDLFAVGMPCEEWYTEILEAYHRICERLGMVDEDSDLEIIITNFLRIQQTVAMEMYRYGAKFSEPDRARDDQ